MPPVMVSALFLIEHAYSHFLHDGLTWRMVLDWQMFCRRHRDEMDWKELEARVDEFWFRRFYDTFNAIGVEMSDENENDNQGSLRADYRRPQTRLGQTNEFDGSRCSFASKSEENHSEKLSTFELSIDSKRLTIDDNQKSKMLEDIWAPLDVHETVTGLRGKLALAGNTWRARWKYRLFTDLTWLQAL